MARQCLLLLLVVLCLSRVGAAERYDLEELAAKVVILANANSEESQTLAKHYASRRGIPAENIILLPASDAEVIHWPEFLRTLYVPLQQELLRRKWIEATASTLQDKLGRPRLAVSACRISYLVVCRGIPLKIEHDPALYSPVPPVTDRAEFRTNAGAVDAELSLIATSGYPISGLVVNPWYNRDRSPMFERYQVVKVSRLDGPTTESALGLVDSALEAERVGLAGRAYVDITGPHRGGDAWFEDVAKQLEVAGWSPVVHRAEGTFGASDRFDAPALYFGWYAWDVNGPFTVEGFRFPPGAVALHLHSFSARTLRNPRQGWTGPLIHGGVTATVGNVYEPYLEFTHQPHLLLKALLRGSTWGDAVFYSLRAVSWQGIAIGDPLYRPFVRSFADQWKVRDTLPEPAFAYAAVREVQRLTTAMRLTEALAFATEVMGSRPSLPMALTWLDAASAVPSPQAMRAAANWLGEHAPGTPTESPLYREAAERLASAGQMTDALRVYERLIAVDRPPVAVPQSWIERGIELARQAQRKELIEAWEGLLTARKASANPKEKGADNAAPLKESDESDR